MSEPILTSTPMDVTVNEIISTPDHLTNHFNIVTANLSAFKNHVTSMQQQLRQLERSVGRELRAAKKISDKRKNKSSLRKPSGFAKPSKVTDELCEFMACEAGTEIARTTVTQFIINYIKERNLQDAENRKIIRPDEALKVLLKIPADSNELTYFNLQKFMNPHFKRA